MVSRGREPVGGPDWGEACIKGLDLVDNKVYSGFDVKIIGRDYIDDYFKLFLGFLNCLKGYNIGPEAFLFQ